MTAINVFLRPDSATIFSDGVFYNPHGVVTRIAPKVYLLPHLSAVLASRGSSIMFDAILKSLSEARVPVTTFDMLVRVCRLAMQIAMKDPANDTGNFDSQIELIIVGFPDEVSSPIAVMIPSHDRHPETPAFGTYVVADALVGPPPSEGFLEKYGVTQPADLLTADIERIGIDLMEAQRQMLGPVDARAPDGLQGHCVGGFMQMTKLQRRWVASGIVKFWPDEVGRPIQLESPAS